MVFQYLKSSYDKLKNALVKTSSFLGDKLRHLLSGNSLDADTLDKIEELLYQADLGPKTAQELTEALKQEKQNNPQLTADQLIEFLKNKLLSLLEKNESALHLSQTGPTVILIIGVNGNGKTTTVAKLGKFFQAEDKKILLGAADTFRAAAVEQLEIWANRLQVDIVKGLPNSDPAAVAFDTVSAGTARKADIIIIDTAGRLHTKTNLMQELEKIKRSTRKVIPSAPHETLLILDASTGQNAVDQAKTFMQHTPITGLVLTKMDGTAKGGIAINIQRQLGIPIKFIGIGEGLDDFQVFNPESFVKALLS